MNSIRARLNLFVSLMMLTIIGAAIFCWNAFGQLSQLQCDLQNSYEISMILTQMQSGNRESRAQKRLETLVNSLDASTRRDELIKYLKLYNKSSSSHDLEILRTNETHFQEFALEQMPYHRHQFLFGTALTILTFALLTILMRIYLLASVLRPLQKLTEGMNDFVQNRYSYDFPIPPHNEIGELQNTFHSMAQKVLHSMEEFQALDSAKSEFLSIASHELRTPMTSIKGSLSLLSSGVITKFEDQPLNLLQIAETETDRLIRLINDILDLAKIEAGKLPLKQQWLPLQPLLDKTVQSLNGLQKAAGVEIVLSPVPKVQSYMDADRIQQVLTNLLSNALKFSPSGTKVTVTCTTTEDEGLLLEVGDQGRGIAPEDCERIFQKFRQATTPESPLVKGTGLGLAIAKALVEEHGGTIGVRSKPGQGSTFYFTLPKWQIFNSAEVPA